MKVILPSNGLLGTKWVDLREPTFEDLRKTYSATIDDEYLYKYEFIKSLCDFDESKITMDDVIYLYEISVAAISLNTIKIEVTCDCGNKVESEYTYLDDDVPVRTLNKESRRCKTTLGDIEYNFNILSAKDGLDIHTYALGDSDNEKMVEEATVCKVLGYEITDDNIEKIRKIPCSIYASCFIFINANKHGMSVVKKVKCPHCNKEMNVKINLDSSWSKMDVPTFISQYASIRDCLDFKSFLKFTIPEFKSFVEYLNAEAKRNKNEWGE